MQVLAHPNDFVPTYDQLKANAKKNKAMLEAILNVKNKLENSHLPLGIHHKRDAIPKYYVTKYGLQSLYHFDMPVAYRLMYTIRKSPSGGKEALFLELLSHDEYNRRFGYFKKKSH